LASPIQGTTINFYLSVDLCVDTSIAGIGMKECVHIWGTHVSIHALTRGERAEIGIPKGGDTVYATYTRIFDL